MTSGGDLCHVGTSKLICETNRWTGPCVMRFLPEGHFEQTIILQLCVSGKYTTVFCFSIGGGDARVPAPSRTWGVERFLECSLSVLLTTMPPLMIFLKYYSCFFNPTTASQDLPLINCSSQPLPKTFFPAPSSPRIKPNQST